MSAPAEEKKNKDVKLALEEAWEKEANETPEAESAGGDSAPSYAELKEAAGRADEMRDLAQRLKAELDNFRKRTLQEKENWTYQALEPLLADLLAVLDNLERALGAARQVEQAKSVVDGIDMISESLLRVLTSHGLERIECVGLPFDPETHDAVLREKSDGADPGTILEEMQPGYRFKDRVLRHPKVKVAVEEDV